MSTDLLASKSPAIMKYNTPTDKQFSEVNTNVRYVSCLVGAEVGYNFVALLIILAVAKIPNGNERPMQNEDDDFGKMTMY